jgi:hypothetical protein
VRLTQLIDSVNKPPGTEPAVTAGDVSPVDIAPGVDTPDDGHVIDEGDHHPARKTD